MASPQAEAMIEAMRQLSASLDTTPTLEQQRAGGDMFGAMTGEPDAVGFTETTTGGVPTVTATPEGVEGGPTVLYFHGGGFVACSAHTHQRLGGHLATASGGRVVLVDYRLAPEHPFPAALEDAVAAYEGLLADGVSPGRVVFAGDSAGGGLVLTALLSLRDSGVEMPAAAITMSVYGDATMSGATYEANAERDLLVSKGSAEVSWSAYLSGGTDPRDPLVSPVFGDLSGLPPLLLQVGGEECLLDDTRMVATAGERDGVDVHLDVWPEMQHVFQVAAGNMPEADEALARAARFIGSHVT